MIEEKTREQLLAENESLRAKFSELHKAESECRWVEAALRESEERYKRLLESITDYIYTVKVENGRPVSTSHGPGCLAVTGYTSEYYQMYPNLWYEMIYEDDRKAVCEQAEKLLKGETVKPLEHRIIHKDGSIRWVRNVPVPHYDKDGNLVSYDGIIENITERKRDEEALKKSFANIERAKKEWEATFDGITDPLFIHDKDFKIVRTNRAYADAAGIDFKEIVGKPYYEVFPKMDGPFRMCLKAQELQEAEEEFSCPVTNRIFKVRFYPIKDVNGGYLYSIHILEDITDRKRTEEELRLRAQLLDSTSDTIFLLDLNGKFVYLNEAAWKSRGYTRDELMGINLHVLDTPEYEKIIETRFRELMEKGQCIFESAHRCKDGSIMPVEISARFIETGGRKLVLSVIRDITERKKAQRRIKEETEITSHLLMIAEATSHMTDIDRLMERVVHCGSEIMGCDICLSYLWDSETRVLSPSQAFGLSHDLVPLFKTESLDIKVGFVKESMKGKKPIIVAAPFTGAHDASLKPAATFDWLPDINTLVVIPLIGKKGPLGLIVGVYTDASFMHRQAQHEREKAARPELVEGQSIFTERDMKIMQGIMHQVSVALDEAKFYKESIDKAMELSHQIETVQTMHEIDKSILSTLEPQEILETAARMVARLMPCDRVTVALVDREKKGFVYAGGFGITAVSKGGLVPFEDTSATEVAETHRAQFVSNLSETKGLRPLEEKLLNEGFLSHIRVPLTIKDEVVGVLNVGAKRPSAFSPEDLSTLEKMAAQAGVALSNAKLLSDMEELFLGTVKSLSTAIDAKSPWTAGHSERVTKYALDIAKEMGFDRDEMRSLELAGLLHDIGKIGTYDFLLDKPGKLEPDEIEMVRMHPVKGAAILESIKKFRDIIPAIRHHHEHFNGNGYPDKLKGEDIPFLARILAVADTYDAMKADRPYRPGRSMEFILEEFRRCSGTQFDPKVVEAFLKVIEEKEEFKTAAS